MKKRLFLFAAYDRDGIIDNTLMHYLTELSKVGDIVFVMDNDVPANEMRRVRKIPNVLYAHASRHGEYDFGSYKRGYQWADGAGILDDYEWTYLVNDSVFGPLWNIRAMLEKLESAGTDFTGIAESDGQDWIKHLMSWFVGLRREVVTSQLFRDFMASVTPQADKYSVILKYEFRMHQLLVQNGYTYTALIDDAVDCLYTIPAAGLYRGVPFLKKLAVTSAGVFRPMILYPYTDGRIIDDIVAYFERHGVPVDHAVREYDAEYQKQYRFTFLGIPIISVYRCAVSCFVSHKVYLFGFIPLAKKWRQKIRVRPDRHKMV